MLRHPDLSKNGQQSTNFGCICGWLMCIVYQTEGENSSQMWVAPISWLQCGHNKKGEKRNVPFWRLFHLHYVIIFEHRSLVSFFFWCSLQLYNADTLIGPCRLPTQYNIGDYCEFKPSVMGSSGSPARNSHFGFFCLYSYRWPSCLFVFDLISLLDESLCIIKHVFYNSSLPPQNADIPFT